SAAAVGRTAAARGDRARDRGRPDLPAVRRAHRRPRPQGRRRDPGADRGAGAAARQDGADGDARPARGRARADGAAPREGRAGRRPGAARVKYLPLIVANLLRKKIRTMLTLGSFLVALFLYGILVAV